MSPRRESVRQAKLPRKDFNEEDDKDEDIAGNGVVVRTDPKLAEQLTTPGGQGGDILMKQLRYCHDVIEELFSKKHIVRNCYFIFLLFQLTMSDAML